jgi:tRNA-2-methylthio-N6-dimethylallyladenosine synthase
MENQIDEKIKSERLQRLQDEIKRSMYNYNKRFLNENLQVLVEKETTRGYFSGRSPYLQSIHFQSDSSCIGNIVDIKVLKVNENSLSGEILH